MTKAGKFWLLAMVMGLAALVETVTGFVLWFGFPEGGGGGRHGASVSDLSFWGLTKHTWIDLHDWFAIALVALSLIHIIIHWKWIVRVGRNIFRKPERVAVTAGADVPKQ